MTTPIFIGAAARRGDDGEALEISTPGAVAGDYVLIHTFHRDFESLSTGGPVVPAGFEQIAGTQNADGHSLLFGGRLTMAATSITVQPGTGMSFAAANSAWFGWSSVWRDVDPSTPYAVGPHHSVQIEALYADWPAMAKPSNEALLVRLMAFRVDGFHWGVAEGHAPMVETPKQAFSFGFQRSVVSQFFWSDASSFDIIEEARFDKAPETGTDVYSFSIVLLGSVPEPPPPLPAVGTRRPSLDAVESYTAWITDQGGNRIDTVEWSGLSWERVLDDISKSTVTAPDELGGVYCVARWGGLEPWRFGLLIERNDQEVWSGPITNVQRPEGAEHIMITALDGLAWFTKRPTIWPGPARIYAEVDTGVIFAEVVNLHARVDNDRWHLPCPNFVTGAALTRTIRWADQEYAWNFLQELLGASVDAYVHTGRLIVWDHREGWLRDRNGFPHPLGGPVAFNKELVYGTFTETSFASRPGWSINGVEQGNYVAVPSADTGERGFRRVYTAQSLLSQGRYDTLFTKDTSTLSRPDDEDPAKLDFVFQARANSILALRAFPPAVASGGVLALNAPVDVDNLRPGSVWKIDIHDNGYGHLLQTGRLKRVSIDVNKDAKGIVEKISPTIYPIGYSESDV